MYNKTIFITSFHGLISRVLQSGVLAYLRKDKNIRIVIFVPDFKKQYFQNKVKGENIVIEGIDEKILPKSAFVFQEISFMLLDTKTMRIIRQSFRGYKNYFQFLLVQSLATFLGRWKIIRAFFHCINYILSKSVFDFYFNKYKPNLILAMDVKNIFDTQMLMEAKKRKIFTIGMVRSWDYLTAKGILRALPRKMIVHNEIIKKEAIKYADMKPENIFVAGMPHFDPYINNKRCSREEFFRRIGISPEKKMVLLAPVGDKFGNTDWQIFEILCDAIKNKEIPDLQILVRVPPGDTVNLNNFQRCKNILFDYPGIQFKGYHRKENEMGLNDLLYLADSIFHSEIIITGPSTMAIDAAAFDKPIILLGFDGLERKDYYYSVRHFYDFDHMQNVVKTKGISMAESKEKLKELVNLYLKNPETNQEGRKKIVDEQCWQLDGKSSQRLADFILPFL